MCVLMTSSCPKCGGGQVFAVGLEEGEVGCGGAEIGGGAESGGTCIQIFIHLFKCFTHTYMYTHTLTHIHTHTHTYTHTHINSLLQALTSGSGGGPWFWVKLDQEDICRTWLVRGSLVPRPKCT